MKHFHEKPLQLICENPYISGTSSKCTMVLLHVACVFFIHYLEKHMLLLDYKKAET